MIFNDLGRALRAKGQLRSRLGCGCHLKTGARDDPGLISGERRCVGEENCLFFLSKTFAKKGAFSLQAAFRRE